MPLHEILLKLQRACALAELVLESEQETGKGFFANADGKLDFS